MLPSDHVLVDSDDTRLVGVQLVHALLVELLPPEREVRLLTVLIHALLVAQIVLTAQESVHVILSQRTSTLQVFVLLCLCQVSSHMSRLLKK